MKSANKLSCRCAAAKKLTVIAVSVLCTAVMFTVPAFAAVNPADFIKTTGTVLKALIIMVGAGFGVFGVVNLLDAYGNDNAASKSAGIKQVMAGAAMIAAATLLVPVLTGMMTDALTT